MTVLKTTYPTPANGPVAFADLGNVFIFGNQTIKKDFKTIGLSHLMQNTSGRWGASPNSEILHKSGNHANIQSAGSSYNGYVPHNTANFKDGGTKMYWDSTKGATAGKRYAVLASLDGSSTYQLAEVGTDGIVKNVGTLSNSSYQPASQCGFMRILDETDSYFLVIGYHGYAYTPNTNSVNSYKISIMRVAKSNGAYTMIGPSYNSNPSQTASVNTYKYYTWMYKSMKYLGEQNNIHMLYVYTDGGHGQHYNATNSHSKNGAQLLKIERQADNFSCVPDVSTAYNCPTPELLPDQSTLSVMGCKPTRLIDNGDGTQRFYVVSTSTGQLYRYEVVAGFTTSHSLKSLPPTLIGQVDTNVSWSGKSNNQYSTSDMDRSAQAGMVLQYFTDNGKEYLLGHNGRNYYSSSLLKNSNGDVETSNQFTKVFELTGTNGDTMVLKQEMTGYFGTNEKMHYLIPNSDGKQYLAGNHLNMVTLVWTTATEEFAVSAVEALPVNTYSLGFDDKDQVFSRDSTGTIRISHLTVGQTINIDFADGTPTDVEFVGVPIPVNLTANAFDGLGARVARTLNIKLENAQFVIGGGTEKQITLSDAGDTDIAIEIVSAGIVNVIPSLV